jgi:hypothetical protein
VIMKALIEAISFIWMPVKELRLHAVWTHNYVLLVDTGESFAFIKRNVTPRR